MSVAAFTYEDGPGENYWFGSVVGLARWRRIPTYTTESIDVRGQGVAN